MAVVSVVQFEEITAIKLHVHITAIGDEGPINLRERFSGKTLVQKFQINEVRMQRVHINRCSQY